MPATVYLITGGARSGKSGYAQSLSESLSKTPIYLATSKKNTWDDDFKERVKIHQADRGDHWTTIEEPLKPSQHSEIFSGKVILVDCLTLWLTNFMLQEGAFEIKQDGNGGDAKAGDDFDAPERALKLIKEEFDIMVKQWDATFIFVTNELGSGTHAESAMSRKFVDMQGWLNQHVAHRADCVVHVVCGIPNIIKELKGDYQRKQGFDLEEKKKEAKQLDAYLSKRGLAMDKKGYFIMKVDIEQGLIVAQFFSCMVNDKGEVCDLKGKKLTCSGKRPDPYKEFTARTAKELTTDVFERWDEVNDLEISVGHAAYFGREAQKAEYCLYSGKKYQQN